MSDAGPAPTVVAPPPVPADVGIIAALPIEVAPFQARFRNVRKYTTPRHTIVEGDCGGKLVALIVAGVGGPSARRGAEILLAGHRPRWLVSAGFAGALDPDLRCNDSLLVTSLVTEDATAPGLEIDLSLPDSPEGRPRVRSGRLVTVSRIIRTAAEKADLRARSRADAVDMESYPIAALGAERGVRFLGVRVISDEAGTDLPPEVLTILGPTGSFRLGAAVGAIWRRPSSFKELWSLREHAHEAADRLAVVLAEIIRQLP
jgi:adenosylhomocysteine nucleosidase